MVTPVGLEGWPEHMYSQDGFGNRFIPCPANCGTAFRNRNDMLALGQHIHTEIKYANAPSMTSTLHGLLYLMHSLRQCLICAENFNRLDNRELFKHNNQRHGEQGDISTFQGFVMQVRRYANFPTLTTPSLPMENYRYQCFVAAYTYMERRVSGNPNLYHQFSKFLGCRDPGMTVAQFRSAAVTNPDEYYPLQPEVFLTLPLYEKDGRHKDVVTEQEWREIRNTLQTLYRTGEI